MNIKEQLAEAFAEANAEAKEEVKEEIKANDGGEVPETQVEGESLNNIEKVEEPSESPTENSSTDTTPSTQGVNTEPQTEVPFNKHPRFTEIVEKANSYKNMAEESLAALKAANELIESLKGAKAPIETKAEALPEVFTDVYGEDPQKFADYMNLQRSIAAKVLEEERAKEQELARKAREEEQAEEQYLSGQFATIADKFGKKLEKGTSDYNEFVSFYLEAPIRNGENKLDLVKSYELYDKVKSADRAVAKQVTDTKKAIAANTTSTSPSSTVVEPSNMNSKRSIREILAETFREAGR